MEINFWIAEIILLLFYPRLRFINMNPKKSLNMKFHLSNLMDKSSYRFNYFLFGLIVSAISFALSIFASVLAYSGTMPQNRMILWVYSIIVPIVTSTISLLVWRKFSRLTLSNILMYYIGVVLAIPITAYLIFIIAAAGAGF